MEEQTTQLMKTKPVDLEKEMKKSFLEYSMSVIVARALPDVRDGLKPVHRRILYTMHENNLTPDKAYRKCADTVGAVLGRYHPHGDASVYDAMVRMAQDFSLRYPLVDGHGNFGSVDGHPAAAYRYTEARMSKMSLDMLADIDKETVDFASNYDDRLQEPVVLPSRFPNLLVNGSTGIAVGMATNIPPHNLCEVVDAICLLIDNPEAELIDIMDHIKGPDFPTGGIIMGHAGIRAAYATGRGRVIVRAKTEIEEHNNRFRIVISEIPYQVNKLNLVKSIIELADEKRVEGIHDVVDHSSREGMRVVIDLKKDANPQVVLNNLFKLTPMQTSFPVNNIALVDGRPMLLTLRDLIRHFVEHRHDVVVRRTRYDLAQAEKRAHILEGLLIAVDHIDEVIRIIRGSQSPDAAKIALIERFSLTEVQAAAIIDMRLRALTGLERDKLKNEYDELCKQIAYYKEVLESEPLQMKIIKDELLEIKQKYGDERRTEIVLSAEEFNPEDFYADDEMVITISHMGYIKRTPLTEYRTQNRGGVGMKGCSTRDEDFIEHIYVTTMHNTMLFFTEKGRCYWLKVYAIPEGTRASKGRAIQNVIQIEPDDAVRAYINVRRLDDREYVTSNYIIMCTKAGIVKKTLLEAYSRPRQNGVNAITIKEGDQLIEAKLTSGDSEVLLAAKEGKAIRFNEKAVRPIGRTGAGVKGITIDGDDEVVGMICVEKDRKEDILVVSEHGYGKRTDLDDYRITNRGGKGVKTLQITEKTGKLIAIKAVTDENDLMIINRSGLTIRIPVGDIRLAGRATQGVKVINLRGGDSIASVIEVPKSEEPESETPEAEGGSVDAPDGQTSGTENMNE